MNCFEFVNRENKLIIFLANKVHLVHQQGRYIQERIGEDKFVSIISGDLNTDIWTKTEWDKVKSNAHVSNKMYSHETACHES